MIATLLLAFWVLVGMMVGVYLLVALATACVYVIAYHELSKQYGSPVPLSWWDVFTTSILWPSVLDRE